MEKLNLGILYGGQSTEHEVSMRSAESVLGALDRKKYTIHLIYISKQGEWLLADLRRRIRDVKQGPDGLIYVLTSGSFLGVDPTRGDAALLRIEPVDE